MICVDQYDPTKFYMVGVADHPEIVNRVEGNPFNVVLRGWYVPLNLS